MILPGAAYVGAGAALSLLCSALVGALRGWLWAPVPAFVRCPRFVCASRCVLPVGHAGRCQATRGF